MIVDYLQQADRYSPLHARLSAAFALLRRKDLAQLPDGRLEIEGANLFALVSRTQGRGRERSPLEAHRRYLDIQFIVSGEDCIGWLPLADCHRISSPYDSEKDIEFYFDRPTTWVTLPAGTFALFYPEDAHAPLAIQGSIHKVVVKVAV